MSHNLKLITYRGGLVSFRIPIDWIEEYGDQGGATFFEPGNETGTLRLSTLTAKAPASQNVSDQSLIESLSSEASRYKQPVETLGGGKVFLQYDLESEERGIKIKIRFWRVAQAIPPHHIRLAMYSYTLTAAQFNDEKSTRDLALLNQEIRACEIATVLVERTPLKKAWWKFW